MHDKCSKDDIGSKTQLITSVVKTMRYFMSNDEANSTKDEGPNLHNET